MTRYGFLVPAEDHVGAAEGVMNALRFRIHYKTLREDVDGLLGSLLSPERSFPSLR